MRRKYPSWLRWALSLVACAIVAVVVVFAVGMDFFHWRGRIPINVGRIVPIPAVIVNGHWNSAYEFASTLNALDVSFSDPQALAAHGLSVKPGNRELETAVLDMMVQQDVTEQLAQKRSITVTQQAVDAEVNKLVQQTGSTEAVAQNIRRLFGWDVTTYAERVIRPYLIRQRLQETISRDDTVNAESMRKINDALARVTTGKEDFQTVASQVNEDVTKQTKGDLQIVSHGDLDPAVEEAAFSLPADGISGVLRTAEGFQIVKVLEKLPADPDKSAGSERLHLAHIFISAIPLDQWINAQKGTQHVLILVTGYRWDAKQGTVVDTRASKNANSANVNVGQ